MSFTRLRIENLRQFTDVSFDLPAVGLTIVSGPNRSGKTTLLDALHLLSFGRPVRDVRLPSLLRHDADGNVDAQFVRIEGVRESGAVKRFFHQLGGAPGYLIGPDADAMKPVKRGDFIGRPPAVVFSPDDLSLVLGEPSGRRKYLDRVLSQARPDYLEHLRLYQRSLEQRNALLKLARESPRSADLAQLDAWDETLAAEGDRITAARREWIGEMERHLPEYLNRLKLEPLARLIRPSYLDTAAGPLYDALLAHRPRDLAAGHTTTGPHRDDLGLNVRDLPAAGLLSQAETRLLALALKWIEAESVSRAAPAESLLLLDDLFSELDYEHQDAAVDLCRNWPGQAILTTCIDLPDSFTATARAHIELPVDTQSANLTH